MYENKKRHGLGVYDLGVCFATEDKDFTGNLQFKVFVVNNGWEGGGVSGGEKFQYLLGGSGNFTAAKVRVLRCFKSFSRSPPLYPSKYFMITLWGHVTSAPAWIGLV